MSQNTQYMASSPGAPLQAQETERPTNLDPREVLIRIHAVAINPADYKAVNERPESAGWPIVPGLDASGYVEAVGEEVTAVSEGDKVLCNCISGGKHASYQTLSVLPENRVAKIPSGWTMEQAASLPVCYFTAVMGLGLGLRTPISFLPDGPTSGFQPESVLVLGGSSALGAASIQLLRLALPESKIITTSSPKHHAHLTATLGADAAIDRSSATLVADVRAASPSSRGVSAILDVVGAGATDSSVFDTLDPSGPKRYAQVFTGDEEIKAPEGVESNMFRSRDVGTLQGGENITRSLEKLLAEGRYKLPLPIEVIGRGLDGLQKGLSMIQQGVSGKKLVVSME